jgi:DNA-binding transcriptional MerR regulator
MKISELSRRSGASIATIKYYLREGLLPHGEHTAPNQAEYGEGHLRRLRLARSLISVGGLSVAATSKVLNALDEPHDLFRTLGIAHYALPSPTAVTEADIDEKFTSQAEALIDSVGWKVGEGSPNREYLAAGLMALHDLGASWTADDLLPYAKLAGAVAKLDLDQLAGLEDGIDIAERSVVLTVLLDPVLSTLRRLAQEYEAARRYQPAREDGEDETGSESGADDEGGSEGDSSA